MSKFEKDRYENTPAHIRAAMTDGQKVFFRDCYVDHPTGLGPSYYQASRSVEFLLTPERRDFFLAYYPDAALENLERFKCCHYDAPPDRGQYAESSVTLRVKMLYPQLFNNELLPRIRPLEFVADTHPYAHALWKEFMKLDAQYHLSLAAALQLMTGITDKKRRKEKLHDLYRLAFEGVYPALKDLLTDLATSH